MIKPFQIQLLKKDRLNTPFFFYILFMENNLKEKFKASINNGNLTKLLLLIVVATISFYPFFSIQKKLNESIGDQPKIMLGSYIFIVSLAVLLVWVILKTRPKKDH